MNRCGVDNPKIGPWRDKLDQLLLANEGKASRERLTLIRLFEELRGLGYDGGYDAVGVTGTIGARSAGHRRPQPTSAELCSGEAYQFDWSHEVVLLSGVTVIVKAAMSALSQPHAVRADFARRRRWCSTRTIGPLLC